MIAQKKNLLQTETYKTSLLQSFAIMPAYLFLGAAFGLFAYSSGFGLIWSISMSTFIYAGSMQFATVPLLLMPFNPIETILLTLSINARHLFYGLSMLPHYQHAGKIKPYLIFSLTDESYSLLVKDIHRQKKASWYAFFVSLLNQLYWIAGTALGALFGQLLPSAIKGIEFSMTALFFVIFLEKLEDKQYYPVIAGTLTSILCLMIFGSDRFIIPSMLGILLLLGIRRKA